MGEFGADAAEIVPHAAQDFLDLGRRFFRERRREIVASDAMLAAARDRSRRMTPAGEIRHGVGD